MDVTKGLRELGLGEYEARAYLALLQHAGTTGYEVAKHSGIPRAKIYEVLGALSAKGIVGTSQENDRSRYHAVAPDVLLDRHLERTRTAVEELAPQLRDIRESEQPPALITVRGHENVMTRAAEVIQAAERRLFISGWPCELHTLAGRLTQAEARDVVLYPVVYGTADLPLSQVFEHNPIDIDDAGHDRDAPAPWLIVVADHREVLIGQPAAGNDAVALWTRNATIATVAAEYVKHDVYQIELHHLLDERGISLNRELTHLQAMWFNDWEIDHR